MVQIVQELCFFSISAVLLLCSWGLVRVLLRTVQSVLLPDFLVYITAGVLVNLLYSAAFPNGPSLLPGQNKTFAAIQFVALFLFMMPSCASLHFERIGDHAKEVGSLVGGSILAFLLALATAPFIDRIAPDPLFINADEHSRMGHFLALSLGAMVTSLPFLTKILINNGLLKSAFGNSILISACLVDILVWIIFSIAVSVFSSGEADVGSAALQILRAVLLVLIALGVGIFLARLCVAALPDESRFDFLFILAVSGILLGLAVLIGLAPIVGMVVAGLAIGSIRDRIAPGIRSLEKTSANLGAPVYFLCVGFSINLSASFSFTTVVVFLLWTTVVKVGAVVFSTSFLRHPSATSLDFGIAMNTRGGPGLVLAAASYSIGLVGISGFAAMTLASIVTALTTDLYLKTVTKRFLQASAAPPTDG